MAHSEVPTHWVDVVYAGLYPWALTRESAGGEQGRSLAQTPVAGLRAQVVENLARVNELECTDWEWMGFCSRIADEMRPWPGAVLQFAEGRSSTSPPRKRVCLDDRLLGGLSGTTLKRAYVLADRALRAGLPRTAAIELLPLRLTDG